MENIENKNQPKSLRSYKQFKEDSYEYRVDEILGDIEYNDKNYVDLNKESEKLYQELKELLDQTGAKLLLKYNDSETSKKDYELYALAEQVYKDLKEDYEK